MLDFSLVEAFSGLIRRMYMIVFGVNVMCSVVVVNVAKQLKIEDCHKFHRPGLNHWSLILDLTYAGVCIYIGYTLDILNIYCVCCVYKAYIRVYCANIHILSAGTMASKVL